MRYPLRLSILFLAGLVLALGVSPGSASRALAAERPVAVSPGNTSRLALTGDTCPAFSWTEVSEAVQYELVVYMVGEVEGESTEMLRQRLPGGATSWTPPLDRCLERGAQYAWSVRAMGAKEESEWSPPNLFEVASGPSEVEFEEALATVQRYLARQSVSGVPAEPRPVAVSEEGTAPTTVSAGGSSAQLVPEAPAVVSLVTEGAIGVGTSTPLADLHVVGGPVTGGLLLTPNEPADGGVSELFLGEDDDGSFGMKLRYDGGPNVLQIRGHENVDLGAWLTIERNTGAATFGGTITGDGSGLTSLNPASLSGAVPVAQGGTGATDAAGARTNLGAAAVTDLHTKYTDAEAVAAMGGTENSNLLNHDRYTATEVNALIAASIAAESACPGAGGSTARYTDCGNGTVRDNNTGLIWLKDASCADLAGTDANGRGIWNTAQSAAAALASGTCGLTDGSVAGDWRQPTIGEFCSVGAVFGVCPPGNASDSLIDSLLSAPFVSNAAGTGLWSEGDAFVGVQSVFYWSATEGAAGSAWFATLGFGDVVNGSKVSFFYVWPVRSGQ